MIPSLTQIRNWLVRIGVWLREGREVWIAVLFIPVVPLLFFLLWWGLLSSWEHRIRLTGMCLELVGLALVVIKLDELRELFGLDRPHIVV